MLPSSLFQVFLLIQNVNRYYFPTKSLQFQKKKKNHKVTATESFQATRQRIARSARANLVGHLQRLASFDEDAILGSHPGAHHDRRGRGQAQGAGAGDAQHRDGCLERKTDDHLCLGDVLVVGLKRGKR